MPARLIDNVIIDNNNEGDFGTFKKTKIIQIPPSHFSGNT
jgi:hypothetical protein